MYKIVIFGGGSGASHLLKGLKLFPVELTSVITVCDNGKSTGKLRKEFSTPAVGDISKVLLEMSNVSNDIRELMNYRFTASQTLENHSIKNLLLTALLDLKGDFKHALPVLEELLNTKGRILPLTEDNVELIGETLNGKLIVGEAQITAAKEKMLNISYNKPFSINKGVYKTIKDADLIIISYGSLYTSILPHLVVKELAEKIDNSNARKMYICNLMSQPGETDDYSVSDHVKVIQKYIKLDAVIANDSPIDSEIVKMYSSKEQKDPIPFDLDKIKKLDIEIISDKTFIIEDGLLRHDPLIMGYLVFSYLMKNKNNLKGTTKVNSKIH